MYTENGRYEPYRRRSYHDEREESSDSDIELKLIREFREKRKVFIIILVESVNFISQRIFSVHISYFFLRKNS